MRRGWRGILLIILGILLLPTAALSEKEDGDAQEITRMCSVTAPGHPDLRSVILDPWLEGAERFTKAEPVKITWDPEAYAPRTLCVQWERLPDGITLRQTDADGAVLMEEPVAHRHDFAAELLPEAVRADLIPGESGMAIDRIAIYEEGTIPQKYLLSWKDTPKKLDYLIIATHPDDDVLFMGTVHPVYGAERGYLGTTAFVTTPNRERLSEALAGVRADGCENYPIFLGYPDVPQTKRAEQESRFPSAEVTRSIVRTLRQYRPLVVFTQDFMGEYGHWQHRTVANAVQKAIRLAADPTYDRKSEEAFGTWQVQKCYVHLAGENPIVLDMDTPLDSMDGRTAYEVAVSAFEEHRSQQSGRHWVQSETDEYASNRFGVVFGTVEAGEDVFDNIDETQLSFYIPPTPSPTEEPTPTPPLTEAPTEEPTASPAPVQVETRTVSPAPTEASATEAPSPVPTAVPAAGNTRTIWFLLGGGALLLVLLTGMILLLKRKH